MNLNWRKVEDELPKTGEDIITSDGKRIEKGFYSEVKEWSEGWCDFSFFDDNEEWCPPTHWVYCSELVPED
jgi:hypothetical protein